ncbi:hypothetical protein ACFOWM_13795 [Ferruginibacter yonginensis]|uniref:Uncharacterized protein n=1 Tax=Ferruginibacter yonginensis TaxID=1310416 RepID=A0ABV8QW31_9BACT
MDTFLQLNKEKLRAIFFRLSFALLGVVSIVFLIAYLTCNLPDGQLLFYILLTTTIGVPIFIMLVGYIVWFINLRARQKTFSKVPFNDIEKIGFHKAYLDESSKWVLTEEIKEGKLNGFALRMNLSKEKGYHFIEFDIPVEWRKLEKSEYKSLTEKFKQHNVEFRIGSMVKLYDTRQQILQAVSDIKEDLELFTTLLRQEGFEPKT